MWHKSILALAILAITCHAQSKEPVEENILNLVCHNVADDTMVANPESCRHYYFCDDGKPTEGECLEGYAFDEEKQMCSPADEVECILCPETGVQMLADPMNCNYFYSCIAGMRRKFECPDGMRFDRITSKCILRHKVQCDVTNICRSGNSTDSDFLVGDLNRCHK